MGKIDEIIKEMNRKNKEDIVQEGLPEYHYKKIPFTSPRMNYCTFGGLPIGKMIEFYGEEHGGKTTTALDIIANYQNMEDARKVLYCDCENTLDAEWAHKLGVDTDSMIVMKPTSQSAEEIFQFILDMVETGEIGLFVIDSLGAMVSQQELEKSVEEKTYAGIAKPLTVFSRKAEMLMQRTQCTGIGINQIREDLNSTWGGITTPGGKGWKHICSVRMQFSRGKFIDEKGNELTRSAETPVGNIVQMSITKIKSAPPTRRVGFYSLNYETGIDYLKDLVDVAIKYGIVVKKGAWFDIVDIETGEVIKNSIQGQANVYSYLEENTDVLERIEKKIDEFITMN
jgi:recombination protein RecA